MKKHLSILLALILVLGSFSTAFASGPIKIEDSNIFNIIDENDDVRIIVELVEEPTIVYANGKYTDLPESTRNRIEKDLLAAQEAVKNDISNRGIQMDYINSYTVAFNGFSGTVKRYDIENIKENPNVKDVYISNEYERPIVTPDMGSSHNMIGNRDIWGDTGYNGEGMVVSIIDTGIDPYHKDMNLTDKNTGKIKSSHVDNEDLVGRYYTEKVPYGYNYFDLNHTIKDADAAPHGMHVGGTVAANGELIGVAPEAQLLAMKVFSNDPQFPSTYDDIYMNAIEDSIKLGVDVINMSLGSDASFYQADSAMDRVITNAKESGVLFAVSAGNSAHHLNGVYGVNFKDHPDIGMVGSPSLNKDTISVASVENLKSQRNFLQYDGDKRAYYAMAGANNPIVEFGGKEIEVVDVVSGDPSEYPKDVNGKIVLAVRGGILPNFTDKIEAAQNAGAAGIIVRNHEDGGEDLINMAYPDGYTIPAIFIGHKAGLEIYDLADKKVSFPGEPVEVDNPSAGNMSDFTSWGVTPSLDMKPEITAPGGQIYSTYNDNGYGTMSGTSMAAPHVAGGTALVIEYINRNFTNLDEVEKMEFAKRILMNTASPILERDLNPNAQSQEINEYSPRLQGAGLMRLDKAVKTPVTVVNSKDNEAKVELKDFSNQVINMTLTAINHSDKDVEYNINTKLLTNEIIFDFYNTLNTIEIKDAIINSDRSIKVPANGSKKINVNINLKDTDLDYNSFVEGFIYLTPKQGKTNEGANTDYPELVVPYVGFYGDWAGENAPRVLDENKFNPNSIWEVGGMLGNEGYYLGYDHLNQYEGWENRVAISPGNSNAYHNIMPYLTLMRNAEKMEFNILNERDRVVKKLYTANYVRKTYARNPNYLNKSTIWDGTVNGEVVKDGKYYYQVKAKPQYENAVWQEWTVPVYVDTKAPEISEINYNGATKDLRWKAKDDGVGISHFEFYKRVEDGNGRLVVENLEGLEPRNEEGQYEINVAEFGPFVELVVVAYDYAQNATEAIVYPIDSKFELDHPGPFEGYTNNKVPVKGIGLGYEEIIATITQDGMTPVVVTVPVNQTTGKFNGEATIEGEGIFRVNIAGKNKDGEITRDIVPNRIFFVDVTAPEITNIEISYNNSNDKTREEILEALPTGGRGIIFVENDIGYAYDISLLDGEILERFENAEEKYVKLDHNVFIDQRGKKTDNLPGTIVYFETGSLAKIRVKVKENFGEFTLYANGDHIGTFGKTDLLNLTEFNDWAYFDYEILPGIEVIEIRVVDSSGLEAVDFIEIN